MRRLSSVRTVLGVVVALAAATSFGLAAEGEWVDLFNGRDMSGWIPVNPKAFNAWRVVDGIVDDYKRPSTDIYTEKWFKDFDAHVEFAIYPKSNAGLYLLGRYEIQILDSYGKEKVGASDCGALYREVAPPRNVSRPPLDPSPDADNGDAWQTFDISIQSPRFDAEGRKTENMRITVVHNGVKIHDNVELEEPTGSRKRYGEEAMGFILIQGDHGPVRFRKFQVRGKMYDPPEKAPACIGMESKAVSMPANKAEGMALEWQTPYRGYAPTYRIYRSMEREVPTIPENLCGTAVRRGFRDCDYEQDATYFYRAVAVGLDGKPGKPSEAIGVNARANQVRTKWLSDASWARVRSNGAVRRNRAYNNKPMTIQGESFEKGIGTRGGTTIEMNVSEMVGEQSGYRFRSTVGLDDSMRKSDREAGAAQFVVKIDGREVFESGAMHWSDGVKKVDVAVPAGSRRLELTVNAEGKRSADFSDWAEARLERIER